MRLLDSITLELKEFFGDAIPQYAILSHRWEDEEVTFQDMKEGNFESKKGFRKIKGACKQAASEGYKYIWVDTCCIDKNSSAELSEAINSMFAWYEKAGACYAYLSDVLRNTRSGYLTFEPEVRQSKWFTRGWTLKELLAPENVVFYNQEWERLGNKFQLSPMLSKITGIEQRVLTEFGNNLETPSSVAQKMSWLSNRTTTRVEDMAYCMLGIFGVYMPPLYGEGENAFRRLQLEILKISDDESIFAWKASHIDATRKPSRGLLAQSSSEFADSGDIKRYPYLQRPPYSITNKGMAINVSLVLSSYQNDQKNDPDILNCSTALLNCHSSWEAPIRIYLQHIDFNSAQRVFPDCFASSRGSRSWVSKIIPKKGTSTPTKDLDDYQTLYIRELYYVSGPKKVQEVQILGEDLQSLLSEIILPSPYADYWAEHQPYQFRMCLAEEDPMAMTFSRAKADGCLQTGSNEQVLIIFNQWNHELLTRLEMYSSQKTPIVHKLWSYRRSQVDPGTRENPLERAGPPTGFSLGDRSILIPAWGKVLKLEVDNSNGPKFILSLLDQDPNAETLGASSVE